jgi:uncharacterized protein (TIGR03066 family)
MRRACHILAAFLALNVSSALFADNPKNDAKGKPAEQVASGHRALIIGKWSPAESKDKATIEFTKDMKLKIAGDQISLDGSYRFIDDNTIEVKISFQGMEKAIQLKITVNDNELTTQEVEGEKKMKETFKRVKDHS